MLTRHRIVTLLLATLVVASLVCAIGSLLLNVPDQPFAFIICLVGALIFGGLLAANAYHQPWTEGALLAALTILCIVAIHPSFLRTTVALPILLPVIFAGLLSTPTVTLSLYVLLLASAALRVLLTYGSVSPETGGPTFTFVNLVAMTIMALGITLISKVSRHASQTAHAKAEEAEAALRQTRQQAQELAERNTLLEQRSEEQQRLLALVATLETPALTLAEGVLFAPIVGHVDSQRAQNLTDRLLDDAHNRRAKVVVIDVSGIVVMDTGVASALLQTARALRLLGCQVVLSGITASVAITLTQLGIELSGVQTTRTPQEALQLAVQLGHSGTLYSAANLVKKA